MATPAAGPVRRASGAGRSWLLWWSGLITGAIVLLGLAAPYFPVSGDRHGPWDLAQRAMGFEALQSLPSWWSTVLPVLAALFAAEAARGRQSPRLARVGWRLLALLLLWLSVDHLVTVHEAVARLEVPTLGPVGGHPIELALAAGGLLAGVALVVSSPRRVVLLLLGAGIAYAASVAVDAFGSPVSMSRHHAAMLEVGLSWVGLLFALAASLRAVRMPTGRSGAGERHPGLVGRTEGGDPLCSIASPPH